MAGFIIRRVISSFLVVVLTSMFVFALFFLGPSNPAGPVCQASGKCTAERLALIEEQMGLNESVVTQYGAFAKGIFVDRTITIGSEYDCDAPCLGISYGTRATGHRRAAREVPRHPVDRHRRRDDLPDARRPPRRAGRALARHRGRRSCSWAAACWCHSIPYYLFALLAWIFLTLQWSIFPATGYTPLTENPGAWFAGLLLPWVVIGVTFSTQYARFTRGSMVETLGEDYIRTATAKGVKSNKVVFKHGCGRRSSPSSRSSVSTSPRLLAGTVFTERIFDINGIGLVGAERHPVAPGLPGHHRDGARQRRAGSSSPTWSST